MEKLNNKDSTLIWNRFFKEVTEIDPEETIIRPISGKMIEEGKYIIKVENDWNEIAYDFFSRHKDKIKDNFTALWDGTNWWDYDGDNIIDNEVFKFTGDKTFKGWGKRG